MCRKLIFLILSVSLVISLAGTASAAMQWQNQFGVGDGLWTTAANWEFNFVPEDIDILDIPATASDPCWGSVNILAGDIASAHTIYIGNSWPGGDLAVLNISGTLNMNFFGAMLVGSIGASYGGGAVSELNLTGDGVVNGAHLQIGGIWAEGRVNVSGSGPKYNSSSHTLYIVHDFADTGPNYPGHLQLDGGDMLFYNTDIGTYGSIDITGGQLRFYNGGADYSATINDYVTAGNITAYDGAGTVIVTFVPAENVTYVTAFLPPVPSVCFTEDFESYADTTALLTNWDHGIDNGTNSQLSLETTSANHIYSGAKSMEYQYDNTTLPYYSEAEFTFSPAQKWDPVDKAIGLHFRGLSGNSADPMYLMLHDSSANVAYVGYPDANDLKSEDWVHLVIELDDFVASSSSFDITDVVKLTIGITRSRRIRHPMV